MTRKVNRDKLNNYRKQKPDDHLLAKQASARALRHAQDALQQTSKLRGAHGNAAYRLAAAAVKLNLVTTMFLDQEFTEHHWDYLEEHLMKAQRELTKARAYVQLLIERDKRRNYPR